MKNQIRIINYNNGSCARWHNRRVKCAVLPENEVCIVFMTTEDISRPSALHKSLKGKGKLTALRISYEAATALYATLGHCLRITPNEIKTEKL